MLTIDDAKKSLSIAQSWDEKKNANWSCRCYSTALMNYLSVAVTQYDSEDEGIQFLKTSGFEDILERYAFWLTELLTEVSAGRLPFAVLGGSYAQIVFTHVAVLLEKSDLIPLFLKLANNDEMKKLGTTFWNEYARGLDCFISGIDYKANIPKKLKGLENYWVAYLELMEGGDLDSHVLKCQDLFIKRNSDKSIKDDAHQIEGSPLCQAHWDFRLAGFKKMAK